MKPKSLNEMFFDTMLRIGTLIAVAGGLVMITLGVVAVPVPVLIIGGVFAGGFLIAYIRWRRSG
jgi:hypothetical protein